MEQFIIYLKEPKKRQLLVEFLIKMDFLEWETYISKNEVEIKKPQKKWKTLGSVNSGGKTDNLNLRDFAHD